MTAHLCISNRAEQLTRWRQAFPAGNVAASFAALPRADFGALLWLHEEALPQPRLEEAIRAAKEKCPLAGIVVISNLPNQQKALLALQSGARGYCHAQAAPQMLQQVATVIANGGLWIGPELMNRIIAATGPMLAPESTHPALDRLTPREREVALAVGQGISNKEVAALLDITERTVKAHLGAIFEKLSVRDRLHLVVFLNQGGAESSLTH